MDNNDYQKQINLLDKISGIAEHNKIDRPDILRFWAHEFNEHKPRMLLCGTIGSGVAEILNSFSKNPLQQSELRDSIIELAEFDEHDFRYLYSDGTIAYTHLIEFNAKIALIQRQIAKKSQIRISGGLLGISYNNNFLSMAEWENYTSVNILISPASAVLGVEDIMFLHRQHEQHRPCIMLITEVYPDEISDFRHELERRKLPALKDISGLEIYYTGEKICPPELTARINTIINSCHLQQYMMSTRRAFSTLLSAFMIKVQEEKTIRDFNLQIISHISIQASRLDDVASSTINKHRNNIIELYDEVENQAIKCRDKFSSWLESPVGTPESIFLSLEKAWQALDQQIISTPSTLNEKLNCSLGNEIVDFAEQYKKNILMKIMPKIALIFPLFDDSLNEWHQFSYSDLKNIILKAIQDAKNKNSEKAANNILEFKKQDSGTSNQGSKMMKMAGSVGKTILASAKQISSTQNSIDCIILDVLQKHVKPLLLKLVNETLPADIKNNRKITMDYIDSWRKAIFDQVSEANANLNMDSIYIQLSEDIKLWESSTKNV